MVIKTRRAKEEDLEAMLKIEARAISTCYLSEIYEQFFSDLRGEMTVAVKGDTVLGFGKLTFQYDGSAWAELLRVDPDYQGQGAGKAIWQRYMEQCAEYEPPAIRMYTGVTNVVSKHLAEQNGLDIAVEHSECTLELTGQWEETKGFEEIGYKQALPLLPSIIRRWGEYTCFNRTFYKICPQTLEGFAKEGKLFYNGESLVAVGHRFLKQRGAGLGLLVGNTQDCVAFAIGWAKKQGYPRLSVMHNAADSLTRAVLTAAGFKYLTGNLLMLEGELWS